jgi:antitoxin ParD1/3/4
MPARNVVLTDHQAALVEQLIADGRYQNASEVLGEGLRLVEQREAEQADKLARLRAAVQLGIDDLEAGRYTTLTTREEFDAHFKTLADKALAEP